MVPFGVSIQNPQQSSGSKMRSLAPGDVFCQAWSAGVASTRSGPMLTDVVTVRRETFLLHQRRHVLRRVVLAGHSRQITTGRDAVVVVVAVLDQDSIQLRRRPRQSETRSSPACQIRPTGDQASMSCRDC